LRQKWHCRRDLNCAVVELDHLARLWYVDLLQLKFDISWLNLEMLYESQNSCCFKVEERSVLY